MPNPNKRRGFKSLIAVALAGFILCTPVVSFGWGAGGHMMVASIAFGRLNPRAKAQANTLLAIPINPPGIAAKSKDFVNAAHWADDLRPLIEFNKPFKELHFIDTPFSTDGTALPAVPTPNIVNALEDNVNILKTSTDQNARAQALRFIIHFVGDIHQPLHCATRVDKAHPAGDAGGNLVSVLLANPGGGFKKSNLHSFWDGGLGSFPRGGANFAPPPLSQIGPAAALATAGNPDTAAGLNLSDPFNFSAWAAESTTLAKDVAYKGIANGGKPSAAYTSKGVKVVRQRVAWGGYRLAALLNAIWP